MRKKWRKGMAIKRDAKELYLEPDIDGRPKNTISSIVAELKKRHNKVTDAVTEELIMRWASEEMEYAPYSWSDLRVISQAHPHIITSKDGGNGESWESIIFNKIERTLVLDLEANNDVKDKAHRVILQENVMPRDLIEAVSLHHAAQSKTITRQRQ